ncbi:MAG: hypothetical protein JSS86_04805 [Cyanobacteria bacterium SZAS LIN-2]|nr:hypothetical protein [Cyanobacteria bacterium SZAS LIN-2]
MTATSKRPALLPRQLRLTPSQVLGPYFIANSVLQSKLFPKGVVGSEVRITGQVMAQDGSVIPSAKVSIWVADPQGRYDNQKDDGSVKQITPQQQLYRGRLITDKDGKYGFNCLRPGNYFDDGYKLWRPAHIHVHVEAAGYESLTTQLYFDDDAHNTLDIPGDDFFLPELVVQLSPAVPKTGTVQSGIFNFVLARVS